MAEIAETVDLTRSFNGLSATVSDSIAREVGYTILNNLDPDSELGNTTTLDSLRLRAEFVNSTATVIGYLIGEGLISSGRLKDHLKGDK